MRKILLVLELEDFRLALQAAMQNDYEVIVCNNVKDGYNLLYQKPDALVLDLRLSGADGISFLRRNHDLQPPTTLMLSSYVDEYILKTITNLQVDCIMRYPVNISSVIKWLDEHLKMKPSCYQEGL